MCLKDANLLKGYEAMNIQCLYKNPIEIPSPKLPNNHPSKSMVASDETYQDGALGLFLREPFNSLVVLGKGTPFHVQNHFSE